MGYAIDTHCISLLRAVSVQECFNLEKEVAALEDE